MKHVEHFLSSEKHLLSFIAQITVHKEGRGSTAVERKQKLQTLKTFQNQEIFNMTSLFYPNLQLEGQPCYLSGFIMLQTE